MLRQLKQVLADKAEAEKEGRCHGESAEGGLGLQTHEVMGGV